MRHVLHNDDSVVQVFGGLAQQSALGHDADLWVQPHGTAFRSRHLINPGSFLSDVTAPLCSLRPVRSREPKTCSGLRDVQPDQSAPAVHIAKPRERRSTSFGLFSKEDDDSKEDGGKEGKSEAKGAPDSKKDDDSEEDGGKEDKSDAKSTPDKPLITYDTDNPKSYCCKGFKDATEKCTGYRVDRGCLATFLDNPGFKKVKSKAEDFAESSKPTYCCKRGSTFCMGGIWVKHEELAGDPPQEGKVGGSDPISTSDIVENAQNCVFKHNMHFRGCRYRDVNVAMPELPPQGKNFQKCDGEVPQLPSRKSRGEEEDDCKDGKDADGNECKEEDADKDCKSEAKGTPDSKKDDDSKEDAKGHKCKEPEIEDQRNIDDPEAKKKEEEYNPELNMKREKELQEKLKKHRRPRSKEKGRRV